METAKDSIKYVRPVYSKTQNGNELVDKTDAFSRLYEDADEYNDINNPNARKAIYETTEDRINQELALAPEAVDAEGSSASSEDEKTFTFKAISEGDAKLVKASKKWGENGEKYIDGYCEVYYGVQTKVIAQQNKRTGAFLVNPEYSFLSVKGASEDGVYSVTVSKVAGGDVPENFDLNKVKVFGRYDSEDDFVGDYLGEVEIKMSDYMFKPRPTSIGVTWSTLTEIVLDSSFNLNAEEYLVTSAAQAIKVALDYKAIRLAYAAAKTNPDAYHVVFDAAYSTAGVGNNNNGTKDSYLANSMTFLSSISTVGDSIYNDINNKKVSSFLMKLNCPNCWEISLREYQQLKLDKHIYKTIPVVLYIQKSPLFYDEGFLFLNCVK